MTSEAQLLIGITASVLVSGITCSGEASYHVVRLLKQSCGEAHEVKS